MQHAFPLLFLVVLSSTTAFAGPKAVQVSAGVFEIRFTTPVVLVPGAAELNLTCSAVKPGVFSEQREVNKMVPVTATVTGNSIRIQATEGGRLKNPFTKFYMTSRHCSARLQAFVNDPARPDRGDMVVAYSVGAKSQEDVTRDLNADLAKAPLEIGEAIIGPDAHGVLQCRADIRQVGIKFGGRGLGLKKFPCSRN